MVISDDLEVGCGKDNTGPKGAAHSMMTAHRLLMSQVLRGSIRHSET